METSTRAGPSFDLLVRPWLPVQDGDETRLVGLRELFTRAHEIADLAVPVPPAESGLLRVLYALAARITGLDTARDSGEWADRRYEALETGRFDADAVHRYFDAYADRFDVFHPEWPFLQDSRLREQCANSSGVNKLILTRPAGNNQVWFGHHTDLEPQSAPTPEAVLFLIAQLYYGPSGQCTPREVGGTKKPNTNAGPLRRTVSFHPVGRTLFESLVVGLPDPTHATVMNSSDRGTCPWELTEHTDPRGMPPRMIGLCSLLTRRARHAALLEPSSDGEAVTDAYVTWAWREPSPEAEDPYLVWDTNRERSSTYPRRAEVGRALWRDLDALLLQTRPGSSERRVARRPAVLDDLDIPAEVQSALRVRAHGFVQDGQTRDHQWYTAMTPPVLVHREEKDPDAAYQVKAAREAAEEYGGKLRIALRDAWRGYAEPPGTRPPGMRSTEPWPPRGEARYWPTAEQEFWALFHRMTRRRESAQAVDTARPFQRLALRVYDEITGPYISRCAGRPHAARAIEHARGRLYGAYREEAA